MTFRKKIIMVSNNRFDNQNEYSISDITNKISTLESKVNSGDSLPVGTITFFGSATVPTGYLICNGVAVSRTTFSTLFSVIGTSFGSGDGKNTFNLPNLLNKFIEGNITVGTEKSAGLPNIKGNIAFTCTSGDDNTGGAFSKTLSTAYGASSGTTGPAKFTLNSFDASRSSSIYGNSDTVQPPSLTLLPCIKAYSSVTNTSDVDVSAFLNTVTNLPANYLSLGDQAISDTQLKSVSNKLRLSSRCIPDYASGIDIAPSLGQGQTWTAPKSGILIHTSYNDKGACYISHTNANNHTNYNLPNWLIYNNTETGDYQTAMAIVSENLVVYCSDISIIGTLMFYPFK